MEKVNTLKRYFRMGIKNVMQDMKTNFKGSKSQVSLAIMSSALSLFTGIILYMIISMNFIHEESDDFGE